MERFIAETSAIAERKAIAAGQEHPLPANLLFTIVGGNELGLFRIENERTGTVVFGTQLVETIVTLAGTSVDTSTDDSTLIEDVANFSNPSDNSTSTEPEPSEDTPSSGLETTEELNELISPGSEFAAQNPEAAASIETIRTNPTSTHSLTIAFVFSDSQESQRGTAYEYISSFSSREVALEMLSESGLTTVGTNLRITAASQVEFQENLAYNLAININNSTVNPEVQLPTALPPVYANCASTMGDMDVGGLIAPGSRISPSLTPINIPPSVGVRSGTRRIRTTPTNRDHGYERTTLRNDVADRFEALRDDLESRGAILTSAGGLRSLGAEVTVGRASLSLHNLGLAHDLATRSGATYPNDPDKNPYIIERVSTSRTNRFEWHIWARATAGETRTIQALSDRRGTGGEIVEVTARVVSLTNLARSHGITGIRNRSCYPGTYGCMEWWHLQCPDLIGPGLTYGQLLQHVRDDDDIGRSRFAQSQYFNATWNETNGVFRSA